MSEVFWTKVTKTESCWIWNGGKNPKGYGRFYFKGKVRQAHRVAWELYRQKEIPPNKEACHTCDNPSCVNPLHIFIGTKSDNMQDAILKGRLTGPKFHANTKKKFCPKGHEYTPDNIKLRIMKGSLTRICRQCYNAQVRDKRKTEKHREKERARWHRRKASLNTKTE